MIGTFSSRFRKTSFAEALALPGNRYSHSFDGTSLQVVRDGVMGDPFFRSTDTRPGRSHRTEHFGTDISGERGFSGDHSIQNPSRGLPVYASIRATLSLEELSRVRAYDKRARAARTGVGLGASGEATLAEVQVALQPWADTSDHSYGGVIGLSCVYQHESRVFTLYVEFLHLITERFLPRLGGGQTATAEQWRDTGKGIGFGPEMQANRSLPLSFFAPGSFPLVGYLGATQTPHVHVQATFFPTRTFSHATRTALRIDPMAVLL